MTPDDHNKLVKIAALLASDQDGERASAAAHATDLLRRNGLTWQDALSAIPVDSPYPSDLVSVDQLGSDELSRLRAELATSEALRQSLQAELAAVQSTSRPDLDF